MLSCTISYASLRISTDLLRCCKKSQLVPLLKYFGITYRLVIEFREHHYTLTIAGIELHSIFGPFTAADHALVQVSDGVAFNGTVPSAWSHQVQVLRQLLLYLEYADLPIGAPSCHHIFHRVDDPHARNAGSNLKHSNGKGKHTHHIMGFPHANTHDAVSHRPTSAFSFCISPVRRFCQKTIPASLPTARNPRKRPHRSG